VEAIEVPNNGRIILDENERGNIYVEGLFVTNIDYLKHGYDFSPSMISLDRDRKLVDSFNVKWNASVLWCKASSVNEDASKIALDLVYDHAKDVEYIGSLSYLGKSLFNSVAEKFYEENGDDAVPVTSNIEYETVEKSNEGKPVIVSENLASLLRSDIIEGDKKIIKVVTVKEQLESFVEKIEDRLSEEELEELYELIEKVNN
jgi:hypothetical protein